MVKSKDAHKTYQYLYNDTNQANQKKVTSKEDNK